MRGLGSLGRTIGILGRGEFDASTTTVDEGVVFEDETDTLIAQMDTDGTAPDATRQGHINTLIKALKDAGIWTKCDRIYVLAAHEASAARLNWKTPGTDTLGLSVTEPTFTVDTGYTGNGTSTQLTTAAALNALTQYIQDSAHQSVWSLTVGQSNGASAGGSGSTNLVLYPRTTTNLQQMRVNTTTRTDTASTDGTGFWIVNRADSTTQKSFRNGADFGSGAATSGTPPATNWAILQCGGNHTNYQIAFASIGGSVEAEKSDFYDAVLAYLQAVGAVA